MATAIGRIESIEGSVEVLHADGSIGVLLQGTTVFANDVITTDGNSTIRIRFLDGSGMNIDSESSVTLNEYAVNPGLIPEDEGSSQVILDASGRAINPDSGHASTGIGEKIGSVETLQVRSRPLVMTLLSGCSKQATRSTQVMLFGLIAMAM